MNKQNHLRRIIIFLILDIHDFPMDKQKELLERNLRDWMGKASRIDDILVMGIRTE